MSKVPCWASPFVCLVNELLMPAFSARRRAPSTNTGRTSSPLHRSHGRAFQNVCAVAAPVVEHPFALQDFPNVRTEAIRQRGRLARLCYVAIGR